MAPAERGPEQERPTMPSPRKDAYASESDVTTSWSEPAPRIPESQEPAFENVGGESAHESVIAEHVVQAALREHRPEHDRETTLVTPTIDIASGQPQGEHDAAAAAPREAAPREAPPDRVSHVVTTFELPPDLVQVETSPGRTQDVQDDPARGAAGRVENRAPRPRPPEEQIASEPLVQVETRH